MKSVTGEGDEEGFKYYEHVQQFHKTSLLVETTTLCVLCG